MEDRPGRGDDALHPVRRLRREALGQTVPPALGGWPPRSGPEASGPFHPGPPARRRHRLLLGAGLLAVLAASAGWSAEALHSRAPTPPGPSTIPRARAIQPQAAADAIGDVRMLTASSGWARRLSDGAVLHTTSGVLRWVVASPDTPGAIIAVSYLGVNVARAVSVPLGASGSVTVRAWSTADGGATWRLAGSFPVSGFSPDLVGSLDFVDPTHGWFSEIENGPRITGTALYRTVDSGVRWTRVATVGAEGPPAAAPASPAPSSCVQMTATFINRTTGWLTGSCAIGPPPLYVSHDGGQSWAAQPLAPIAGGLFGESSFPPSFTSPADGTLLTEDIGAQPVSTGVFATTDGGRSWSLRYSTGGVPFGLDFLDARRGYLVMQSVDGDSADPDLYSTADGGASWSMVNAFPFSGVSLDFLTLTRGWVSIDLSQFSAGASYLVSTRDGGRSWTGLRPAIGGGAASG